MSTVIPPFPSHLVIYISREEDDPLPQQVVEEVNVGLQSEHDCMSPMCHDIHDNS